MRRRPNLAATQTHRLDRLLKIAKERKKCEKNGNLFQFNTRVRGIK